MTRFAVPAPHRLLAAFVAAIAAAPAVAQPLPTPHLALGADVQTVFQWSRDACDQYDFPDSPARVFRSADGALRVIAAHMSARVMSGPDLERLRRDCRIAHAGRRNDDPGAFDDRAWILSPYTLDGRTVYALIHNEFHGNLRPALCPSRNYQRCWANAITFAVSRDGGATFARPPGDAVVMALPYRYEGEIGARVGYFNPSNIVAHEGFYYALVFTTAYRDQQAGVCLIRTDRLDDPKSWRGWDGRGFSVRFVDPYRERVEDPRAHVCAPVGREALQSSVSLVRHVESGLWIATMTANRPPQRGGRPVSGIYASVSRDLITWSVPTLVRAMPTFGRFACEDRYSVGYPALVDPQSTTRNFESFGGTGWLYMSRFNLRDCRIGTDRDLVRVAVSLTLQ